MKLRSGAIPAAWFQRRLTARQLHLASVSFRRLIYPGGTAVEAAVIANYAAGVEVGKSGAATVSGDEVIAAYDHFANSRAKS